MSYEEIFHIYLAVALSYVNTCLYGYACFAIYRLVISKRSIFENRNYCEKCDQPFNSIFSYPIIGYVLCLGKCLKCKSRFGSGHFKCELSLFLISVALFFIWDDVCVSYFTSLLTSAIFAWYFYSSCKIYVEYGLDK